MKKTLRGLLLALFACVMSYSSNAQLNGTYTIGGASPNFTTLSAAISALNAVGVNGPVVFNIRPGSYSGTTWQGSINAVTGGSATNRVTFRAENGDRTSVSITMSPTSTSNNYIFKLNNANYISIKDMTLINTNTSYGHILEMGTSSSYDSLVNCVLTGAVTTSSDYTNLSMIYMYTHTGTTNVFQGNAFQNGATWAYIYGTGTTSTSNDIKFISNTFSMTNSGYYGMYLYYTNDLQFIANTFTYSGSNTYYLMYNYYTNNNYAFSNNTVTMTSTTTMYGPFAYYANYYSNNPAAQPRFVGNTITTNNTSGTTYCVYSMYWYYGYAANNTINGNSTTGSVYMYGPLYMAANSKAENNTINMYSNSSGYLYNMSTYQGGVAAVDTFVNNTINMNTASGYIYNYMGYYGSMYIADNQFNTNSTSSYNYNSIYYSQGITFARNKVRATTNTGYVYGLYVYNTTSYGGGKFYQNDIDATANSSGTAYGLYPYYAKDENIYNNIFTTKTNGGSDYSLYVYYTYSGNAKNNTFYSNTTSGTLYGMYIYNPGTSYTYTIKNNIFSRAATLGGYGIYAYSNDYKAEYNLFNLPTLGTMYYCSSPAYSGTSLHSYRAATGREYNSVVYVPPFTNAAGRDFSIVASSQAAWAINGRAEHDTLIKTDFAGVNRPITRATGVPDIGAYQVTPTSTPPDAIASPATPVANGTQVFTFAEDTVQTIEWGASVPSSFTVRQYTGIQAAPIPVGVGRMYFYTAGTPASWKHTHKANVYYKDPWTGDIPNGEKDAVIARSSNAGAWEGYNYTNSATDTARNILKAVASFDSVGSYTGVQNGRIGIRCVEDPKGLLINGITAIKADIFWQPVFNPIGYQVVVKTKNVPPTPAEWASGAQPASNSMTASNLAEDTKYYVFVRSVCGVKDTSGYAMDSFTTIITCHTPVVTLSSISQSRVIASWGEVKTAIKYEYALTKSATPPSFGTDINKTSVLTTYLDPGTQYYVHVRAHCNSIYAKSDWTTVPFMTHWPESVNDMDGSRTLSVYPNPVHNTVNVTVNGIQSGNAVITVMDMTGKVLSTQAMKGSTMAVNVTELPAGMYILQYADDNRSEHIKFSKQ